MAGVPADGPIPAEASASSVSGSGAGTTLPSWLSLDKGMAWPQVSRGGTLGAVESMGTGHFPKRDSELSGSNVSGESGVRAPS